MHTASNALRTAYFKALKGQVLNNGAVIPVYKKVLPASLPDAYIILSTETGRKAKSKGNNHREHTMLVDIVTKFDPYSGGNELADDIQEQISEIIDAGTELDLSAYGYQCVLTEEEDSHDIDLQTPTETIIRKLIRYRHLITKV